MTEPIPAATLIVLRDRTGAPPELLMVERARTMTFAAGALVFPGGRIDPGDHALAGVLPDDADDSAGRIAAIRETIEEAGLAIGLAPLPSTATLAALRARLHAGDGLGTALKDAGIEIALDALVPFARWLPSHSPTRIFDTRFYLARLPAGAAAATIDATENVRLTWTTAAQVLADADAGRAKIIYPTRRNLERLAQFGSFEAAVADARARPVRTIVPFEDVRGGVRCLCIPEDSGYPVTAGPFASAMRG